MPTISLHNGRQYAANDGESLLAAGLRAELTLELSRCTGRCSSCKPKVVIGSTSLIHDELGLTPEERESGSILTCSRTATSVVDLDLEHLSNVKSFPAKTFPCRIQSLERLATDVLEVLLRFSPSADLQFLPGQYIEAVAAGVILRSYSIANAPRADKLVELHIWQVSDGTMRRYWIDQTKATGLLLINGPLGTLFLRDAEGLDLLLLATGTGIARSRRCSGVWRRHTARVGNAQSRSAGVAESLTTNTYGQ